MLVLQSFLHTGVLIIILMCLVTALVCQRVIKNPESVFVVKLSEMLHSGYGNVIFLMAGILWASSVSVLGSDIKNQIFTDKELSWETFTFFTTVLVAIIIGVLHYVGQQRKDRISQSRPPLKAIQVASKHIIGLKKNLSTCLFDWVTLENNGKTRPIQTEEITSFRETLTAAKKACLQSLLHVAHAWDDNNDMVTYSSNLFNIMPSDFLLKVLDKGGDVVDPVPQSKGQVFSIASILNSPFFLFNDNWRAKLERSDFLLVSEQKSSVSLDSSKGDTSNCREKPPSDTPPICMPFSEGENSAVTKQPNIHGAPTAIKRKRAVYIPDVIEALDNTLSNLIKSPDHQSYINAQFKQDLYKYYNADPTKSILSIPIRAHHLKDILTNEKSEASENDDWHTVCIVNVYSNKINMFANDDMANSYCDLVKPIFYVMSLLVAMGMECTELQAKLQGLSYNQQNEHGFDIKEADRG